MIARPEIVDDDAVNAAWLDQGNYEPFKDRVNHASKIGHPCDRFLVLRRTHGDKAAPPSLRLKAIFRRGNVLEQPIAVEQLKLADWRVWDEQRRFDIVEKGQVLLSCKIDALIQRPPVGVWKDAERPTYVVDHKIVNPHDWEKIPRGWEGFDYLRQSAKPWLHAWPAQVESYMYAHSGSAEVGLLQLINAETLLSKFVYVPFDVDYMQEILDRCIRLNGYTDAVLREGLGALPPPIEWSESVCGRCELLGICMPDQTGRVPLQLMEDDSFDELVALDRELAAKKSALEKEYEAVHDRVRHAIGDNREIATPNWWITQKEIKVNPKPREPYSYMRMDIKPLRQPEVKEEVA